MISGLLSFCTKSWIYSRSFIKHIIIPELLSKNIYTKCCNGYSLRGKHCLLVPRFNNDVLA